MKEHLELVLDRHAVHHFHQQLVVVGGYIDFFKKRSYLKLTGCHFVMACAYGYAELERFNLKIFHVVVNPVGYGTEIMVVQLLAAGRIMPEHRATTHHQVGTGIVQGAVYHEILLLTTQRGVYAGYITIE